MARSLGELRAVVTSRRMREAEGGFCAPSARTTHPGNFGSRNVKKGGGTWGRTVAGTPTIGRGPLLDLKEERHRAIKDLRVLVNIEHSSSSDCP
jgi:hypothetical protein